MFLPFPDYGEIFYSYHGTDPFGAINIEAGNIDITAGGGELGRGFYTGQYEHEAKTWAFHISKTKLKNVVKLEQKNIYDFLNFDITNLDINTATQIRNSLKTENTKRTHLFKVDMVISRIIGSSKVSGSQVKWESDLMENYLNGNNTIRTITW
jgi:hypothetical protein